MNFHLIFAQDTKSPYYVGDDKVSSLWMVAENTLRNMDKSFRSSEFQIPQVRLGKPNGRVKKGFIIECADITALSAVFGELAKMTNVDATVKFPIEIHPEGLTDTYAKFLD